KVDTADRDALVYEKFNLGFSSVIGVSAEHGRNIDILENEIAVRLSERVTTGDHAATREADIRIAILGKPNTGKSTLLNALLNENRSIVSEVPGTTRDVIEGHFIYKEMNFTILDTAGIRKKKKVSEAVEYYSVNRAIKTIDDSDIVVLLVDAQEGFTEQDKKIANLIDRKGRGFILCLNKWDLTPDVSNQLAAMRDRIEFIFPYASSLPILPLSALNKEGIEKLLDTSIRIHKELFRRVDTGELNRALGEWVSQYHLPDKTRIKIRYMTQVGVHPVQFVIFTNSKSGFPDSYLSFLRNRIREQFGFHHVPIQIEVRTTARQTP
ncbi:MAG: ribosome biogenesis GTPase Der, partial [Spirochaetaceae bacterium]